VADEKLSVTRKGFHSLGLAWTL